MKIAQVSKSDVLERIEEFITHGESRERLILKMPFACSINRIELYFTETPTNTSASGEFINGKPFDYIFTLTQYNSSDNKVYKKISFSYINEFTQLMPKILDRLYSSIKEA